MKSYAYRSSTYDAPCISFESPNIELPETEIKMGVASSRGLPCPILVRLSFEGDYLSRATIYCVITVFVITKVGSEQGFRL